MNTKGITRRLDALQQAADRNRPCKMTITLKSGEQITADPAGAWAVIRNPMMRENVVSITADRPEYRAAAAIWTIMCHFAPDRRIEDCE